MKHTKYYLVLAAILFYSAELQAAFVGTLPSVLELFITPGKVLTGEVSVTNPDVTAIKVDIEVQEGWEERTGTAGYPPEKWLKLDPGKSFTLKPDEVKKVKYKIKLPREFSGEAMAMVFFNVDSSMQKGGPVNMQMRYGVPFYVIAKSSTVPDISIKDFKAYFTDKSVSAPLSVSITLKNNDKVHIRPRSKVSILSAEGKGIEDITLEYGYPLYPGNEYSYSGKSINNTWIPGVYTAVINTECGYMNQSGGSIGKSVNFVISDSKEVGLVQ